MQLITTVQDRLTITLVEVKAHLKIDGTDQDVQLSNLITAAKAEADAYMQCTFLADDGVTELTLPGQIKQWCLKAIAYYYDNPTGGSVVQVQDLGRSEWRDKDLRWYRELEPYRVGYLL